MGATAESILVETLMNGAGGVQYFYALGFESPLDYYHVARAFALLAPYEDILLDGSLEEHVRGEAPGITFTARRLGERMLLLAGNYGAQRPAEDSLFVPGAQGVELLSDQGKAIVACLAKGEMLVDQVIAATGIPSGLLLRELTLLEVKGVVARLPGNRIALGSQSRKNK